MTTTQGRPGVDLPDRRGRTGLDRVGRDLTGNPDVRVVDVELLASSWHVLRRTTLEVRRRDGRWTTTERETYDRGDGAVVVPYDLERGTVLLTRQFRYPAYVNGHPTGMLVEAAAGLLDADDPATAMRREAAEELGVGLGELQLVFTAYMSPGSVTEKLFCYVAPYRAADRVSEGGGVEDEGEDVEVLEVPFAEALEAVRTGEIADAKTIMLLQWLERGVDWPAATGSAAP